MNAARWQQIKTVFSHVLKIEPSLRSAYIVNIGLSDPDLQQRVARLLEEHESDKESDQFLRDPAVGLDVFQDLLDSHSPVGTRIGPYKLVQELGAGGMGEVYLARRDDAEFDQQVAIKVIRSGQESAAVVSRFKSERQILAGLDHPNIAKLLDGGRTAQGQPYFVMEYVSGIPITQYCDERRLPIADRLKLLIQACEGVQHAHQNAIIHRDLKPSNILVVEVDGKPVPRIIDFGLAKTTEQAHGDQALLTRFGAFMGTPGYMSPEQADLRVTHVDTRTDVYSLGAVLYVLLTGWEPFATAERRLPPFDEWLRRLREDVPLRPSITVRAQRTSASSSIPPEVSGDLDWITLKALERDRERRYATPAELAADLRRHLLHQPVAARPPSTVHQLRLFVRRHRVGAAAASAVVVALTAGLAVALWQAQVAGAAARDAHAREAEVRAQSLRVRQMSALSAEQAGDAASQLGLASAAVARLAYAVRLDPDNPTLRSHLMQLLEEQDVWWLPRNANFIHAGAKFVRISPDGRCIVTGAEDGSVILWDADSSRQIGTTMHHTAAITVVNFSEDGRFLITGSADRAARVWDVATGQPAGPALLHGGALNDASFSHDGTRVITASEDRAARIWDWRGGRVLGTALRHRAAVLTVQFSPDDTRIVTASGDHTARLWDGYSGRPLTPPLQHGDIVGDAEFSADGQRVVTASADSTAQVWDARTGRRVGQSMHHTRVLSRAQFSPDGLRILTASWDRTARLWDARTGDPLGDALVLGLQMRASIFSNDGGRVFAVTQDGMVRMWDGLSGKPRGALVRLASAEIAAADISVDGTALVTTNRDGKTQVWERRVSPKWSDPLRRDDSFRFMRFSVDGRWVATDSPGHTATLWNLQSGEPLLPPLRHDADVTSAEFSADDAKIATTSQDGSVHVWRTATGDSIGVPIQLGRQLSRAAFSPDGALLLIASSDGMLRLFDASTGQPHGVALSTADAHTHLLLAAFSPDGTRVAAAINDETTHTGAVRIWNAATGDPLCASLNHPTEINDWKFSPDGARIATVAVLAGSAPGGPDVDERILRIWDAHSGAVLGGPVYSAETWTTALQFSGDGSRIVLGTMNAHVRLWDGFTGAPVGRVMAHDAAVLAAEFSPDGAQILTVSLDENARVWDAGSGNSLGAPLHHDGAIWTGVFSDDGTRIVTASSDRTAQVWDAVTHLALTGPMRHDWVVRSAQLSHDGTHVLTKAWRQNKMRLWPVLSASADEALRLADLAEAVGGYRVDSHNAVVPIEDRQQMLKSVRAEFGPRAGSARDVDRLYRQFLRPTP